MHAFESENESERFCFNWALQTLTKRWTYEIKTIFTLYKRVFFPNSLHALASNNLNCRIILYFTTPVVFIIANF